LRYRRLGRDRALYLLAQYEQFALEGGAIETVRAADEDVPQVWRAGPRQWPTDAFVDVEIAPAEETQSLLLGHLCELFLTVAPLRLVARQEHQPGAVLAGGGQVDAQRRRGFAQERVGKLDQHAGPVTRLWVTAAGTAVGQVFKNRQPLFDDGVGALAVDVGDKPHAAGVVLEERVIETLGSPIAYTHGATSGESFATRRR